MKIFDGENTIFALYNAYRNGSIKPSDIITKHLDLIANIDQHIGSYQEVWNEEAIKAGAAADIALESGGDLGVLHGIPFALKDIFHVKGKKTTFGSAVLTDQISQETGTLVRRLRNAGAIILGKSKTVECAFGGWGTNQMMGTPRNPWDTKNFRICGGSSSGSAAAVASRMAVFGIGSDTGGSVRLPAGFCGLVGLKPTAGILPLDGVAPLSQTLDSPGPISQSVFDAAILFQVILGQENWQIEQSISSESDFFPNYHKGLTGLRLGIIDENERAICSSGILKSYDNSIKLITNLGASVEVFKSPFRYKDLADANGAIIAIEGYSNHSQLYSDPNLPTDKDVRTRMLAGKNYSATEYLKILLDRKKMMVKFFDSLGYVDALLMPTTTSTAIEISKVDQKISPAHFTRPFNFLGMCALAIPIGLDNNDLPTSLQIVARPNQEALLFQIGTTIEKLLEPIGRPNFSL